MSALPTSSVGGSKVACGYTPSTPASEIAVNRNQLQVRSVEGDLWDQTEVTARFDVKEVRNDFVGGVEGGREVSNPVRTSYTINGMNSVTPTNLADPNPAGRVCGDGIRELGDAYEVGECGAVLCGHAAPGAVFRAERRCAMGLLRHVVQPVCASRRRWWEQR